MAKPFPGIPRSNKSDATQEAITESIEVLTGQRGNNLNRALLYSDLVNLNALQRQALIDAYRTGGTPSNGLPSPAVGIERPVKPTGVTGQGGFTFIALTWDTPNYKGHSHAEIYRSETDDYSTSVLIAREITNIFSNTVNMGSTYFYWIRFVNEANIKGPLHDTSGLEVSTQESAAQILEQLAGKIEKSHLGEFLTTEVAKIPEIETSLIDITAETESVLATSNDILSNSESMARNLINSALVNDQNWDFNRVRLVELESELNGVKATITSEFYTITAANTAIAAAAQTIETKIEEFGITLSGDIESTYYTKTTADEAIALKADELKSAIEDPDGDSLAATLYSDFYTKVGTDEAISTYGLTLKSAIEDPEGNSIGANLVSNYYTKVNTDEAISVANNALKSAIEDPEGNSVGATLATQYETKANSDETLAKSIFTLSSSFDPSIIASIKGMVNDDEKADKQRVITADFIQSQKTLTNENEALSQSLTELQAQFDESAASVTVFRKAFVNEVQSTAQELKKISTNFNDFSAEIVNNYYTKTTADEAIAEATQILRSAIEDPDGESVAASLQTLATTVATNDEKWSMWAVKATVGDLTSSFGLVNDGDDPIFAIHNAKFAVTFDGDEGSELKAVFGVDDDGKVVINTAIIDQAFIQSLVTDELLSNRLVVGSKLTTPSINYDPETSTRTQNFSIDPSGNMVAKSAVLHSVTIKDAAGNTVFSSTGQVSAANVTGLGSLATANSLSFDDLTSKPTLGNLAALDSLSFDNLTGKPTLGDLAAKDSLGYSEIEDTPTLGELASKDTITKDKVTDFNTGVTTIIDSAFVKNLLVNQFLAAKIYGNNIEGDIYNIRTYSFSNIETVSTTETTVATITVKGLPNNVSYDRILRIERFLTTVYQNYSSSRTGIIQAKFYLDGTFKSSTNIFVSVTAGTSSGGNSFPGEGKGYGSRKYIEIPSKNTDSVVTIKITAPTNFSGLKMRFSSDDDSLIEVALFKAEESLA